VTKARYHQGHRPKVGRTEEKKESVKNRGSWRRAGSSIPRLDRWPPAGHLSPRSARPSHQRPAPGLGAALQRRMSDADRLRIVHVVLARAALPVADAPIFAARRLQCRSVASFRDQ
jgi:hypothetical protein